MRILILKRINVLLGAGLVSLLTLSLVIYPEDGVNAAVAGLKIFWEIVFPSLLPFFVLSEIMLGMGVVHFIGVLLEPLMRPLFNVPGVGAFALSMGLAAGYPMDAVITGKFRRSRMCTRVEGERLLSFTNTADPLFIFGAVAVGMFGRPDLGVILAIAHYIASFTVGVIFKYYH
ncbi:MAG: nucleoside recognition domain-containing protein, partial [Bacteroidota bacterium]